MLESHRIELWKLRWPFTAQYGDFLKFFSYQQQPDIELWKSCWQSANVWTISATNYSAFGKTHSIFVIFKLNITISLIQEMFFHSLSKPIWNIQHSTWPSDPTYLPNNTRLLSKFISLLYPKFHSNKIFWKHSNQNVGLWYPITKLPHYRKIIPWTETIHFAIIWKCIITEPDYEYWLNVWWIIF